VQFNTNVLTNKAVKRSIDLRTHIEEVVTEITTENIGKESTGFYFFAIQQAKAVHLSYITAYTEQRELKVQKVNLQGTAATSGTVFYRVTLPKALDAGNSVTFSILLAFTHSLTPLPESINQDDDQLVEWFDNHFIFSVYPSNEQITIIRLPSETIEGRTTNEKPNKVRKDTLEYGPYKDVPAFADSKMRVHFLNNFPFVTMTKYSKEIEVSHWGNVALEEHYYMRHTGAKLKGSFSRYDYQRGRGAMHKPSFRTITAVLPKFAHSIYYRDIIGNVSTSHVRKERDQIVFEIDPRFPMFGGWATDFQIGYSIPASKALSVDKQDPTLHVLNLTFTTPFAQAVIDKQTVKVVLPEGATDIRFVAPFPVDEERETRFTYLDTTGRPVVVLKSEKLCRYHNQNFQVIYRFNPSHIYVEPLMLASMFFSFFVIAMLTARLDLSLTVPGAAKPVDTEASSSAAGPSSSPRGRTLADIATDLGAALKRLVIALESNGTTSIAAASNDFSSLIEEWNRHDGSVEAGKRAESLFLGVKNQHKLLAKAKHNDEKDTAKNKFLAKQQELQQQLSSMAK